MTVVALQAVRGHILEINAWPDHLNAEHRVLANFLDLPLSPHFLSPGADFTPYEHRYSSRITALTGHPSKTKNFQSGGKSLRDFAEHRLETSLEGALFLCLRTFARHGRASIPLFTNAESALDMLKSPVSTGDMAGIAKAMEFITNPMLETGHSIIKMSPTVTQEFPNFDSMRDLSSIGKTLGDLIYQAVSPTIEIQQKATA